MEPPTASPRRRAPTERTEQLLDAAERVLLAQGLASTTVSDIADAAGVAKGTLYLYFPSKDAVMAALRARYLIRFSAAVNPAVASGRAGAATRLDRFVDGLFEFSGAHQALHHLLFHEAGYSETDALAGGRAVLTTVLSDGVASGAFDVRDVPTAAGFLLHGLHGLLVDAMASPPLTRPRIQQVARDLARRSVGA